MSMEYCHKHHHHYDTDWDLECNLCFDEIEDEADLIKIEIDKMKKQWTNYELAIVFYYVKFGSTFGIKRGITLSFNQLVDYVGHGEKSFWLMFNKIASVYGYKTHPDYSTFYISKSNLESCEDFNRLTVSQMRNLLEDLRQNLGDENQLSFDF